MTNPPRLADLAAAWRRRVTFRLPMGEVPVVALPDLVATKKTQRDKDWATIGELVEADIVAYRDSAVPTRVTFWLEESREVETLWRLVRAFPELAETAELGRPLLAVAKQGDRARLEMALAEEQIRGKAADREYWAPIQAELEQLRHELRRTSR